MPEWFEGGQPRDGRDAEFVRVLRDRAPQWAALGLTPERTSSLDVLVPFVAQIDLGSGHFRYLEAALWPTGSVNELDCQVGEGHVLDNLGPDSVTLQQTGISPAEAAELCVDWFTDRLQRSVSSPAAPTATRGATTAVGWFAGSVPEDVRAQAFHAQLAQSASELAECGLSAGDTGAQSLDDGSLVLSVRLPWLGETGPRLWIQLRHSSHTDQNLTCCWALSHPDSSAEPLLQVGGMALDPSKAATITSRWLRHLVAAPVRVETWTSTTGMLAAQRWTQTEGVETRIATGSRLARLGTADSVKVLPSQTADPEQ